MAKHGLAGLGLSLVKLSAVWLGLTLDGKGHGKAYVRLEGCGKSKGKDQKRELEQERGLW